MVMSSDDPRVWCIASVGNFHFEIILEILFIYMHGLHTSQNTAPASHV